MADLSIQVQSRTILGKRVGSLRAESMIPAVVYGGKENLNITLKRNDFVKIYKQAGASTIINLVVDGKKTVPVLINDEQVDPVTSEFIHADFYELDLTKEITVPVQLIFVGEAPAIKELGGTLVHGLSKVEIRCLPTSLIHTIEVDLSSLKTYDDVIHVSDLKIPTGVAILNGANVVVAKVVEQKVEVEAPVAAAAVAPELVGAAAKAAEAEAKAGEGDKKGEKKSDKK